MAAPSLENLRGSVLPGEGLVARAEHAVVFIAPHPPHQAEAAERLLEIIGDENATGRTVIRATASLLGETDASEVPSFCMAADVADDLAAIVHGDATLVVHQRRKTERFSGKEAVSWVEQRVPSGFDSVFLCGIESELAADEELDLRAGIVRGGGIGLLPRMQPKKTPAARKKRAAVKTPAKTPAKKAAAKVQPKVPKRTPRPKKASAPPPTQVAVKAPRRAGDRISNQALAQTLGVGDFSVLLTDDEPVEQRAALPRVDEEGSGEAGAPVGADSPAMVDGILCSRGHLNNPAARFCGVCGISLVQLTHNTVRGQRPPLGYLVLDDGATFNLDRDYVIGREPEHDSRVVDGEARPLLLDDPSFTISRAHASVTLIGWDVVLTDEDSANGTQLANSDDQAAFSLEPHEPLVIQPGAQIFIGDRVLTFDAHARV